MMYESILTLPFQQYYSKNNPRVCQPSDEAREKKIKDIKLYLSTRVDGIIVSGEPWDSRYVIVAGNVLSYFYFPRLRIAVGDEAHAQFHKSHRVCQ